MKALIPNIFRTGGIVDGEDVNDNLRSLARDIKRSNDRRYTYSTVSIPLAGLTQTATQALRTIRFFRPVIASLVFPVEIVGMELSVFSATGATWSVSVTDDNGVTETLSTTTAGVTEEAYDATNRPLQMSTSQSVDFVFSADASNTITAGFLVLHLRCDRHAQNGTTRVDYEPDLVDASTSSAGSVLDTQLAAAQTAVTADAANGIDLRCECVLARNFSTDQRWALPSGINRVGISMIGVLVAAAAEVVEFEDGTNNTPVTATGTSDIVEDFSSLVTKSNDPTDTADDVPVSFTMQSSGPIALAYAFLWWG